MVENVPFCLELSKIGSLTPILPRSLTPQPKNPPSAPHQKIKSTMADVPEPISRWPYHAPTAASSRQTSPLISTWFKYDASLQPSQSLVVLAIHHLRSLPNSTAGEPALFALTGTKTNQLRPQATSCQHPFLFGDPLRSISDGGSAGRTRQTVVGVEHDTSWTFIECV